MSNQMNSTPAETIDNDQDLLLHPGDNHEECYFRLLKHAPRELAEKFTSDELMLLVSGLTNTFLSRYSRYTILYEVEEFIAYEGECWEPPLKLSSDFSETLLGKIEGLDVLQEVALVYAIESYHESMPDEDEHYPFDPEYFFRPRK